MHEDTLRQLVKKSVFLFFQINTLHWEVKNEFSRNFFGISMTKPFWVLATVFVIVQHNIRLKKKKLLKMNTSVFQQNY